MEVTVGQSQMEYIIQNYGFKSELEAIESAYFALGSVLPENLLLISEITTFLTTKQHLYLERNFNNDIKNIQLLLSRYYSSFDNIRFYLENIVSSLKVNHNIQIHSSHRLKNPMSIFLKMHSKSLTFEELYDVIGFRLIVKTETDCYSLVKYLQHYAQRCFNLTTIRDYISSPKNNGYRSMHLLYECCKRNKFEIQIRSRAMHDIAQFGAAAHAEYKYLQFRKFLDAIH